MKWILGCFTKFFLVESNFSKTVWQIMEVVEEDINERTKNLNGIN